MAASEISLFDVEDVVVQPKVRDMNVGPVSMKDTLEFCSRYHYTERAGHAMWRWGLWCGPVLYGVICYNWPSPVAGAAVFGSEYKQNVLHIGRLALPDSAPRNSESRLIGQSLRQLEDEHPEVWAVLTYAATDEGHIGYVYQATNAIYTGVGGDGVVYKDQRGQHRSPRSTIAGSAARITKKDARTRGWTVCEAGPKHRYVYILGNKTQRRQRLQMLKYPILPYPKQTQPEGQTA
jgi:hypothetical protein